MQKDHQNIFRPIKTAYNKSVSSKTEVADCMATEMLVPETEPMWIAFDRSE